MLRERRIYFWVLALLIVVLLNLPSGPTRRARAAVRDVLAPFEHSLTLVWQHGRRLFSGMTQAVELAADHERLRHELAEQAFRIVELEQIRSENEALRRQLGFTILSPRRLLLAEVIARGELSGWWQTIRINKGHRDGILPDMAVMTSDGLIGRTHEVSARTSEVLLITDPNSRVGSKIARNDAMGILRGGGPGLRSRARIELLSMARPAEMNYLPSTETIEPGDLVVTSGLGHVFPEGLPVGRVVRVRTHESGLYQQAYVEPQADLRSIRHVFIVME